MKKLLFCLSALLLHLSGKGQQVAKTIIVEHFTNTHCSICASRNPGLYSNLINFPAAVHIAYYPSAPYPACPLSMHNVAESDARTNYYGIYGGTPRLEVGGSEVTLQFTDPSIFSSQQSLTSSFTMQTGLTLQGTDSVSVRIAIKKVDTSSLTSLQIYSGVAEDTLSFIAQNGEAHHYDVFRKSFWGTTSLNITAPVAVGDSSIYTATVALNNAWDMNRIYAFAILQKTDKEVVQGSRSALIPVTTGAETVIKNETTISIHPNPVSDKLFVDASRNATSVSIIDLAGRVVKKDARLATDNSLDVRSLDAGIYFLILNDRPGGKPVRFVKL